MNAILFLQYNKNMWISKTPLTKDKEKKNDEKKTYKVYLFIKFCSGLDEVKS